MIESQNHSPFRIEPAEPGRFVLKGSLNAHVPSKVWDVFSKFPRGQVRLDLASISSLDLNGAAQLLWLRERLRRRGVAAEFTDPPGNLIPIWRLAVDTLGPPADPPPRPHFFERMGRIHSEVWADFLSMAAFLGELLSHLLGFLVRPWRLRWADTFFLIEQAVIDALPVTALVAFLVGLILAFQSAMFMRLFGVDIFVADLVGLALIRELGTLLTAIVLTGRSGSAFSAELGAMKANQEIDAFVTMGLSPSRDLVLPRVMALTMATPFLTILANFAGLLGGNVVMVTLGHPIIVFWEELSGHIDLSDVMTGLFKAFVFGFTVATIGCQRGLAAGNGPTAVGQATTHGVVTNIIVLAVLDSLFAILFYVANW
ncbi:MAG: ABC transporter permease [Deltaproteobacteria bacterium]|nr:ABC transporter permease [Deltaproteobacteria bacterium]